MILLFPHSATKNHGCEAIVYSTAGIFEKCEVNHGDLCLLHKDLEHDDISGMNGICEILDFKMPEIKRGSIQWVKHQIMSRLTGCKYSSIMELFSSYMKKTEKPEALVSIGGDNYCYGKPYLLYAIDRWAKKNDVPLILWGCSVEETDNAEMIEDLKLFDLIVARESISYAFLAKINRNKVILCADPAFTLQPEVVPSDIIEVRPDTVGINISPMIMGYEEKNNVAFQNYVKLMDYILTSTEHNIMLIPHVTVDTTNDLLPLEKLYELYQDTGRVQIVGDMKCSNLKYLISRCRYFVGARTHATIAAYSSNIPTLVVGYSVKAKGIAQDLFGTYENYVLPVQGLKEENQLKEAFCWLEEHEYKIRNHLNTIMPKYIESAYNSGRALSELLR